MVKLEVMGNGAVFIDNTRITDRSTKLWGWASVQLTRTVAKRNVVKTLIEHGFSISRIDDAYYTKQVEKHK